jgi:hypothetical protein
LALYAYQLGTHLYDKCDIQKNLLATDIKLLDAVEAGKYIIKDAYGNVHSVVDMMSNY